MYKILFLGKNYVYKACNPTILSTERTSVARHSSQHNITQHGMLPQYQTGTAKLICDFL